MVDSILCLRLSSSSSLYKLNNLFFMISIDFNFLF